MTPTFSVQALVNVSTNLIPHCLNKVTAFMIRCHNQYHTFSSYLCKNSISPYINRIRGFDCNCLLYNINNIIKFININRHKIPPESLFLLQLFPDHAVNHA